MENLKDKFYFDRIENEKDYHSIMIEVDALMKKGEANLTDQEFEKIRILALAAQEYEQRIYAIPEPKH